MKNFNDRTKGKQKQKKTIARDYIAMAIIIIAATVILLVFPDKSGPVLNISKNYLLELVMVLLDHQFGLVVVLLLVQLKIEILKRI